MLYPVEMDSDMLNRDVEHGLCFAVSFGGGIFCFFSGQQNCHDNLLKNSVMGEFTEMETIWFSLSIIYPTYQVQRWS